ncbi:hypothetical protein HMPREF1624_00739 [Sporothrix schenckii ATCC 58251]|uniref:GED domain-containing protein n=1 Tax=Sporothrix schenckii (strain ATCC 58251 / de Perez 2211183) TaxID=1391915 RepID=U7Q6V2_SPOS1|nr:hypothetical protein HMPREF1624_00739 [Sporothrix schenckii ATCC 58251]
MRLVKQEPGGTPATGVHTAANRLATSSQEQNGRFARSGAPSIDTRFGRQTMTDSHAGSGSGGGGSGGDDDDAPILMEVRKIKTQPPESILDRLDAPHAFPAHAHQGPNVSFVSHGFTAIGDKVKELNDTLGELQSLGIQHVTSLPELVLVGDQSAGKSSLMSGFSDIYLPRSEGACTRCPVHIRLSGAQAGGPWACRISLQQDYDYRPPQGVTRANPFGPWFEKRRDIKDFANLNDPSKIEETLRWAQIATLNPNRDHSLYKPGTGEMWRRYHPLSSDGGDAIRNEAAFSPNTVALDISAPGLADLSFYDLPGVFTSAKQDEDQYLVQVVRNLTAKYISHKQAIILWAVPMNVDSETSSTFSIIREKKAQARTIGIMTKADLLPPNPTATAQWMAMLRGEQHKVGHGYFMTARPIVTEDLLPNEMVQSSHRDPSRPADELERQGAFEEAFFNKQLPGMANQEWRECFREFEDRCGVNRLVAFMSQQLGHEFAKCLPEIKEKVSMKLLDVNYELAQLPDVPENPELEIRRSLVAFTSQVRAIIDGPQEMLRLLNEIFREFKKAIADLKPKYKVKVESLTNGLASGSRHVVDNNGRIDLTSADNDDVSSVYGGSPAPGHASVPPSGAPANSVPRRRQHSTFLDGQTDPVGPSTPSKRARGLNDSVKQEDQSESGDNSPALGAGSKRVLFSRTGQPLQRSARSLQAVRDIIDAQMRPGMPNIVTGDIYNSLSMEAIRPWIDPLMQLLERVFNLLDAKLHELLSTALSNLRKRLIYRHASSALKKFLVDRMSEVQTTLLQHYQLETRKYHTLDRETMARNEEAERNLLARHRHYYRMVAYLGEQRGKERPLPKDWDIMSDDERAREKTIMNQELAKLGADEYTRELGVCANVRGYYRTAATRFVDTCTMHISSGLLPDVTDQLSKSYLDNQLGVFDRTTPQTFLDLMGEDEATAQKRASLKDDRRRFQLTMESIQRLENSSQYSQEQPTQPQSQMPVPATVDGDV